MSAVRRGRGACGALLSEAGIPASSWYARSYIELVHQFTGGRRVSWLRQVASACSGYAGSSGG